MKFGKEIEPNQIEKKNQYSSITEIAGNVNTKHNFYRCHIKINPIKYLT